MPEPLTNSSKPSVTCRAAELTGVELVLFTTLHGLSELVIEEHRVIANLDLKTLNAIVLSTTAGNLVAIGCAACLPHPVRHLTSESRLFRPAGCILPALEEQIYSSQLVRSAKPTPPAVIK